MATLTTNGRGQLRFPALPPGVYLLDLTMQGFSTLHEADIVIGAGATIERTVVLKLAGIAESVVVEGAGSRIEARKPGFGTRFGPEDIKAMPTRRASMFDWIRAAPGISPTSPSSRTATTISAFGSGTNENQFLIDGTNFTCPCNGVARAEPAISFRKSRSSLPGRLLNSATFKALSSTFSHGRAARGCCMTRRTIRKRQASRASRFVVRSVGLARRRAATSATGIVT